MVNKKDFKLEELLISFFTIELNMKQMTLEKCSNTD
jgi:hypothetical protein